MDKNTKAALIFAVVFLAAGLAITTNTVIGHVLLPVVTYLGGNMFAYVKIGKWSWKPGILWGLLGLVFSVIGALIQ